MKRYSLVFLFGLLILAAAAYAQDVQLPPPSTGSTPATPASTAAPTAIALLNLASAFIAQLQAGDKLAAMATLVSLLMTLIKMPFFQAILKRVLARAEDWELGPRQKHILVFSMGVGSSYLFLPHTLWLRLVLRGVFVGLAAIGLHQVWVVFVSPTQAQKVEQAIADAGAKVKAEADKVTDEVKDKLGTK